MNWKKALVIIGIVLAIGAVLLMMGGGYSLSFKGASAFSKSYWGWLKTLVRNAAEITAYAVHKPWLPQ